MQQSSDTCPDCGQRYMPDHTVCFSEDCICARAEAAERARWDMRGSETNPEPEPEPK